MCSSSCTGHSPRHNPQLVVFIVKLSVKWSCQKKNPRSHQLGILYAIMINNLLWVINGKIYVASPGLLVSDISAISVYSK